MNSSDKLEVAYDTKRIDLLKKRVAELDAKTDSLNSVFDSWEKRLDGVRIAAYCDLGGSECEEYGWQMGWRKFSDVWCLVARRIEVKCREVGGVQDVLPDHLYTAPMPLTSAPRYVRISASVAFDTLLSRMESVVGYYNSAVERSIRTAST